MLDEVHYFIKQSTGGIHPNINAFVRLVTQIRFPE